MSTFTHKILDAACCDDHLWKDCTDFIKSNCHSDSLYKNYLEINFDKFLFFNCLIDDNKIVSFGGIEYSPSRWGIKIARVLSKFWIHPEYRSTGLTKWDENKIRFSPLILAPQLEFLKSQDTVKVAMITREGNYRKSFREISRLASSVSTDKFDLLDGRYDICRIRSDDDSCWQMISISSLGNEDKFEIFKRAQDLGFLQSEKI